MAESRFVFYSHDGLGRDLAIAAALTEAHLGASVLLVTGRVELGARPLPPGTDLVALPGDRQLQAAAMSVIVDSFGPDVLLVDEPALASLPEWDGRTALGLSDFADPPADDVVTLIRERCERLLVYGNSGTIDVPRAYGLPQPLGARIRYCGYVVAPDAHASDAARLVSRPRVLACSDGSADGRALLAAFVAAGQRARWDAAVIPEWDLRPVADCDVLVCSGAYDTLSEALSRGTPTVCVPSAHPRTEQLIRARAFADLGLLRLVEPWRLNAELLGCEVAALLGADRHEIAARAHASLGFDGARMAARELLELAEHPLGLSDRAWLSSG